MLKYFLILLLAGCASTPSANTSAGADSEASAVAANPAKAASDAAYASYERFINCFSSGNVTECADFFDQTMIGRQELVNSLNSSKTNQKNISIEEQSSKTQALGETTAVVTSVWEKRYLNVNGSQVTQKGETKFFMQKTGNEWKLVGLTGDNLLLP